MSDLADDVRRARDLLLAQPMRPYTPLLSPRCGLDGQHAPECRSAICECECHWSPRPTGDGRGDRW